MTNITIAPTADPERRVGAPRQPPPHAVLWELATVAAVSRCLHVIADLGVADAVPANGAHIHDVAATVGADADALGRMLRVLASYDVFDVSLPHVKHTSASELLRTDHPMSMGAFAQMMGLPMSWGSLTHLGATARDGRAGIHALEPGGLFAYLEQHGHERAVFDRAMTAKSHADLGAVLDAYDFGTTSTVADIGGGRGHLVDAIATRHPDVTAFLVELPDVIARVSQDAQLHSGVRLHAADFFVGDLPPADVYVLMEVIHDWDDDDAVRILQNIRGSASPESRIVIIETLMPEGAGRDPAKTLDIVMLAVTGGRERTPAEFDALFARAGFERTQVLHTAGAVALVEARPVAAG